MTNAEAIERLENDCCKSRVYCELYPDACQKEECEIYMAIEALQRTSNALPTHECVKPTHECIEKQVTGKLINVEIPTKREPEKTEKQVKDDLISREDALDLPDINVGKSEQLNRTCAKCKHYTKEHLCVFWSYFGFSPKDYCSRWEGADDEYDK